MNTVVAQRVRSTRPAAAQEKPAGGNAVNPSLEARAAPSMARTVPPAGISRTPTGRSRRASLRESVLFNLPHEVGHSFTPRVEPGAPGARGRAQSGTGTHAQGVGSIGKEPFRDRARQDVAPGAAMDGFTAFPEGLFSDRTRAVYLCSRPALRIARLCQ